MMIFILSVFMGPAKASVAIESCDREYAAILAQRGMMHVKHGNQVIKSIKIDHNISGGIFSLDDTLLVVYGLPEKIDQANPQATRLSIYAIRKKSPVIIKKIYGGGIYAVSMSIDQRLVSVESQFALDVLNLKTKITQTYEPTHELQFEKQQCATK